MYCAPFLLRAAALTIESPLPLPASYIADNLDDIWVFSTEKKIWTKIDSSPREPSSSPSSPGARHNAASWVDVSKKALWLFGGSGMSHSGESGLLNDLWKSDLASRTWSLVGGSDQAFEPDNATFWPGARSHALTWIQPKPNSTDYAVYMFGGTTTVGAAELVWRFESSTLQWLSHPIRDIRTSFPGTTKEFGASMYFDSDRKLLFMYGGWSASDFCPRNAYWSYNTEILHWSRLYEQIIGYDRENSSAAPLFWPAPRRGFVSASDVSRTFIVGGECIDMTSPWCATQSPDAPCDFVLEFRHVEQSWSRMNSSVLKGVSSPLIWMVDDALWIFSGIVNANQTLSSQMFSLRIDSVPLADRNLPAAAPSFPIVQDTWDRVAIVMTVGSICVVAAIIVKVIRKLKGKKTPVNAYELHPVNAAHDATSSSIHS